MGDHLMLAYGLCSNLALDAKETLFLRFSAGTAGLSNTFNGRGNVADLPASSVSYTGEDNSSEHACVADESSLSVVDRGTVIRGEYVVDDSFGGGGHGGACLAGCFAVNAMASRSSIALLRCDKLLHDGCIKSPSTVDRAPLVSTWFVIDLSSHVRKRSSTVGWIA